MSNNNVARVIASDILSLAGVILGLFAVCSFLLVCIACGIYLSYVILMGNAAEGMRQFHVLMSLKGFGIHESIRPLLSLLNWIVLFAAPVWIGIINVRNYALGVNARARLQSARSAIDGQVGSIRAANSDVEQKQAANS